MAPKKNRRTIQINGKRIERTFATKALADEWITSMRKKVARVKAGLPAALDEETLLVYCGRWIQLREKKSDFWRQDESKLRKHILPRLGDYRMRAITKYDLENALHDIRHENNFSEASFNRYRGLLHLIFEDAKHAGHVELNPVSLVEAYPEQEWDLVATDAEIERYLTAAVTDPNKSYFYFAMTAMNTGLRTGELIGLKWQDIDFKNGLIHVVRRYVREADKIKAGTKARKKKNTRWVPVSDLLMRTLAAWHGLSRFGAQEDFIFTREDGKRASVDTLNHAHVRVHKRAKVRKGIRFYDLTRHAYGTRLSQLGNMRLVQVVLGHSDSKTSERYSHNTPDFIVGKAAGLEIGKNILH